MKPVYRAILDRERYALLLTPARLVDRVSEVTLAPISSGRKNFPWQVEVGPEAGLDHDSVVRCESITTISRGRLRRQVGEFPEWRVFELRDAVLDALGLPPVYDD